MRRQSVGLEDVDALLRFLPRLAEPGRAFIVDTGGGEDVDDMTATTRYPVYADDVLAFFRLAGAPCWSDFSYDPRRASEMLEDEALIARATLDEIKTLLTVCVRGERFSDGYWGCLLSTGKILAILRRLAVLRDVMGEEH